MSQHFPVDPNAPLQRCDMCGPYSAEQAAAIVLGTWTPTPTGHLCARCRPMVAASAQLLADRIDADAAAAAHEALKCPERRSYSRPE